MTKCKETKLTFGNLQILCKILVLIQNVWLINYTTINMAKSVNMYAVFVKISHLDIGEIKILKTI